MYHSITFQILNAQNNPITAVNTYQQLHIVPTSRPVIVPPSVKTHYIDIPGADGSIDLSDSLASQPRFSNRSGSIDFAVYDDSLYEWPNIYERIITILHGQKARAVLEDYPSKFYLGRWAMTDWKQTAGMLPSLTLSYNLDPFPYDVSSVSGLQNIIDGSW